MSPEEAEEMKSRTFEEHVSKTKQAAEVLIARRSRTGDHGAQGTLTITDQLGNLITLPQAEENALTIALTLHEMGRAELKRDNYSKALLFCLEAEEELGKCSDDVLKMVDNVGLLCLDIVWCYLCLQNVNSLPDAASISSVRMLNNLLKEHQAKQQARKELQDRRRAEVEAAVNSLTVNLVDQLNYRVSAAYSNQKRLDVEAKKLQANAATLAKHTGQWVQLIDNFNDALKEMGDVENWAATMERDMQIITEALEQVYKNSDEQSSGAS